MMGFKQAIDNFKAQNAKAGTILDPSLLPLLMNELIRTGLNISHADGKFYQSLAEEVYPNENKEFQLYMVDALLLLGRMIPLPNETEQPKAVPPAKKEAIVQPDGTIRTDHLIDDIPDEDSEGDPYYMPPEEQLNLRPEDCEPMHIDHEFMASIGAKGYEK